MVQIPDQIAHVGTQLPELRGRNLRIDVIGKGGDRAHGTLHRSQSLVRVTKRVVKVGKIAVQLARRAVEVFQHRIDVAGPRAEYGRGGTQVRKKIGNHFAVL